MCKNTEIYEMLVAARNELEAVYWKNYNDMIFAITINGGEVNVNEGPLKMLTNEYNALNAELQQRIDAQHAKIHN